MYKNEINNNTLSGKGREGGGGLGGIKSFSFEYEILNSNCDFEI